jgi:hypothetical protein
MRTCLACSRATPSTIRVIVSFGTVRLAPKVAHAPTGTWVNVPSGASEPDFEEDLFAAIRFAGPAQAALLVPVVETLGTAGMPPESATTPTATVIYTWL